MKIFQRFIAEIELIRFDFLQKKEIRWWKKHHPDFDIVMVGVPIKLSETARKLLRERNSRKRNRRIKE